jgi:putative modified peptide
METMSQQNVERVMGRLLTDDEFRRRFAADPPAALAALTADGVALTTCELAALERFDARVAERCARAVDPRLLKADLGAGSSRRRAQLARVAPADDAND